MSARNLPAAFLDTVERLRHRPCLRFKDKGRWKTWSWFEVRERVRDLAFALKGMGVSEGDRVAICSGTRPEWTIADLAILSLGAVTVPIYPSSTADQVAYILANSSTKVVFVEDEDQRAKVLKKKRGLRALKKIVPISEPDPVDPEGAVLFEAAWLRGLRAIAPSQTATIVYTSGTTGAPKGVVLTHKNFLAEIRMLQKALPLDERHIALFFLPLAHIFARAMQFWQLSVGYVNAYGRLETVVEDLRTIRPHFFGSVPRIFEKIHEKILSSGEGAGFLQGLARRALSWRPLARLFVFRKIRALFGGRLRFTICGGAPLSRDVAEFFHVAGVLITEGYGLTETTAGIFINTEKDYRFGTVGKAVPGVSLRFARDGEILVKSPTVFQGYYRDPKATRVAFTRDGWFKTGDIGRLDRDGFLKITDRKKDLIITSAGKNIAPQNIEKLLMTIPYISHAAVQGEGRNYLTALVTLNPEAVEAYARRSGLRVNGKNQVVVNKRPALPALVNKAGGSGDARRDPPSYKTLAKHPEIHRLLRKAIEEKNGRLASFETVKKFAILENDFTQATGELTPTLTLKRRVVSEKYKHLIDRLYQ